MPIDVPGLVAFNRGVISRLGLARVDVSRVALSAEEQTNWMPRTLGSMMLRPGLAHRGSTRADLLAVHIPFIFAVDDTAIIELTSGRLRVRTGADDALIARAAAGTQVVNPSFVSGGGGWVDDSNGGSTNLLASPGGVELLGTGFAEGARRQTVTRTAPSGTVHGLRLVIARGPVTLEIRDPANAGKAPFLARTTLGTGTHSLTFVPDADFQIRLSNTELRTSLVTSATIEAGTVLEVPTPWTTADLPNIRWAQSRDVVFVACKGRPPYRIERRLGGSWSVVRFEANDGPFGVENFTPTTISPSSLSGEVGLFASRPLFRPGHVGALFKLTSFGQQIETVLGGDDQFTGSIRVTGVGTQRKWTYSLIDLTSSGTTVTLQRSVGEEGAWSDVSTFTTSAADVVFDDGFDNLVVFYRFGIKSGDHGAGSVIVTMDYSTSGTTTGIARITSIVSETQAMAQVLKPFGSVDATSTWVEGAWSDFRGWPTAVGFYEGRLWFFGQDRIWGSVSDNFSSFDTGLEGDAAAISRTIGGSATETINWMLPLQRLLVGGQASALSIRSSSLDEPLTQTQFTIRPFSSQGTAPVAAVAVDTGGFYVQRNGRRVYEALIGDQNVLDYVDSESTALVPEIGAPGILRMAVQRQPDTRLHCVRADGKVVVFITDRAEEVRCWVVVETAGDVEDAFVLPGEDEDRVYYLVRRVVNGVTRRFLERWATEDEARGGTITRLADSHVVYEGAATATIAAAHLEGEEVVAWANGNAIEDETGDVRTFTVSGGVVTLPEPVTSAVVGLAYEARFKSSKLAYAAPVGTALTMRKRIAQIGVVLADTHHRGLRYGPSYDKLDPLPEVVAGEQIDIGAVFGDYDYDTIGFPGDWDTDARLCLVSSSPRPATVLAAVMVLEGHRKF